MNEQVNTAGKRERDPVFDVIRIVALLSVNAVHFFFQNHFYKEDLVGLKMLGMTFIRTFFMICVPLFLMLSGALMNKKKLSGRYYRGITKVLGVYLLGSVLCAVYRIFVLKETVTFASFCVGVLKYSMASYSWYVEMYIGLFLLIPFLNLIYHGLQSRRQKLWLVITLSLITALPTVTNFSTKILPDWWWCLYPLTFYFLGAYLEEFRPRMPRLLSILLMGVTTAVQGLLSYYMSAGGKFVEGNWQDHRSLLTLILSVLVFQFLLSFDMSRTKQPVRRVLKVISDACFGGYIVSWLWDNWLYRLLRQSIPEIRDRIWLFVPMVLLIFTLSIVTSILIGQLWRGIEWLFSRLWGVIRKRAKDPSETA